MGALRVLLDTHIFLWWLFDDPKLPDGIKGLVTDSGNDIYVSAASVWEIATKFRIGKLPHAVSVAKNTPLWIERAGFRALSITPEHAQLAGSWEIAHKDPFDRMLAAQSSLEKMALASIDEAVSLFPIKVIDA